MCLCVCPSASCRVIREAKPVDSISQVDGWVGAGRKRRGKERRHTTFAQQGSASSHGRLQTKASVFDPASCFSAILSSLSSKSSSNAMRFRPSLTFPLSLLVTHRDNTTCKSIESFPPPQCPQTESHVGLQVDHHRVCVVGDRWDLVCEGGLCTLQHACRCGAPMS